MAPSKKIALYQVRISDGIGGGKKSTEKVLKKFIGIEGYAIDMDAQTLQVTGHIEPTEILTKLRKKISKLKAKLINVEEVEEKEEEKKEEEEVEEKEEEKKEEESYRANSSAAIDNYSYIDHIQAYQQNPDHIDPNEERWRMFDDENTNSCSMM